MMNKKRFKPGIFVIVFFIFPAANAVAPRITQDMFGQEVSADILTYDSVEANEKRALEIGVEIVKKAFDAENITMNIGVVPSKQLAIYALFNGDVRALIGMQRDLEPLDKSLYFRSVFYVHNVSGRNVLLVIYFDKNVQEAEKLFSDFNKGLEKIIDSQL